MSNLRDQIGGLSVAEKIELLDLLWESLETENVPLSEAQRAELDYRIGRHEQNPSDVIPWEQVRAGLDVAGRLAARGGCGCPHRSSTLAFQSHRTVERDQ
jgi:putative addiction module component (TIGR02574 family)